MKNDFDQLGYHIDRGCFTPVDMLAFETVVTDLFLQQKDKIGDYRNDPFYSLSAIIESMEAEDKEALYQVQKFLPKSQSLRSLFNESFMDLCADLLETSNSNTLLLDGPALFVNRPRTQRLLYKWHSEAHYYPKRRTFLNVWLPFINPKNKQNGAMSILPRSHLRDFPFSEYTGYNKDTEGERNHFVQYEIPKNFLTDYIKDEVVCETVPGDAVLFHRQMVHTSNPNTTDDYSFAIVARVWDPSNDLTISGDIAATPYGGDIGRSNLMVRP